MNWNKDLDDNLLRWQQDGWSAAQIADRLGCSRNAVIGRLFRLKNPTRVYVRAPKVTKWRERWSSADIATATAEARP